MKKRLLTIVVAVAAALCMSATAFAASLVPSMSDSVEAGDKITLTLTIDEVKDVKAFSYAISYDADKLEYVGASVGDAYSGASVAKVRDGLCRVSDYSGPFDIKQGTLCTFTFKAKTGLAGSTSVSVEDESMVVLVEGERVTLSDTVKNGTLEVEITAPHVHSYDSTKHDASGHWLECSCGSKAEYADHAYGEWQTDKEATEDAVGKQHRSCDCGYVQNEDIPVLPHTHKYSEDFVGDLKGHWQVCIKCEGISDVVAHEYGEWTVTKEAEEFKNGSRERTCGTCGYVDVEVLSATHEHTFDGASFTGDAKGHWQVCTHELCEGISEVADHEYDDWTVTKEATEDAAGSKTRTCEVCEYVETAEIPALGSDSAAADSSKSDSATSSKSNLSQTGDATMVVAAGLGCLALIAAAGVVVARKKGLIG